MHYSLIPKQFARKFTLTVHSISLSLFPPPLPPHIPRSAAFPHSQATVTPSSMLARIMRRRTRAQLIPCCCSAFSRAAATSGSMRAAARARCVPPGWPPAGAVAQLSPFTWSLVLHATSQAVREGRRVGAYAANSRVAAGATAARRRRGARAHTRASSRDTQRARMGEATAYASASAAAALRKVTGRSDGI